MTTEEQANLGLATTDLLFSEVITRLRIPYDPMNEQIAHHLEEIKGMLSKEQLEYRTVDHG